MNVEKEYCDALNAMAKPGGASSDKIEAVEKELGVVFPAPYCRFLAQYGAGVGTGFEQAGIFENTNSDEQSMWRSVLLATKQLRRVWRERGRATLGAEHCRLRTWRGWSDGCDLIQGVGS